MRFYTLIIITILSLRVHVPHVIVILTDMEAKPSILFKFRRLMVFAHFSFIPARCYLSTMLKHIARTTCENNKTWRVVYYTAVFNILNICFPWYMNSKYCKWMLDMKYVCMESWSYWTLVFFPRGVVVLFIHTFLRNKKYNWCTQMGLALFMNFW